MRTQDLPKELLTLSRLRDCYGLSIATWRRAIRSPVDPLPCLRVGLGDPAHARILVRRADLEAWLERRNRALSVQSIVDEVVDRVLG